METNGFTLSGKDNFEDFAACNTKLLYFNAIHKSVLFKDGLAAGSLCSLQRQSQRCQTAKTVASP